MTEHRTPSDATSVRCAEVMTAADARQLIEAKRQEFVAAGGEPYALLLDTDLYEAVYECRHELGAETVIHDCLLRMARGCEDGVAWWDEREHEKAEEWWQDHTVTNGGESWSQSGKPLKVYSRRRTVRVGALKS